MKFQLQLLLFAAWTVFAVIGKAEDRTASTSPTPPKLASFKERLAAAKSVRVKTDLLGIEIGSELDAARHQLSKWIDPSRPSKEPAKDQDEEGERKVLFELKETDFSSILVKVDEKDRITYMIGILRSGKEVPFTTIGEVEKAPIRTDHEIAWDVLHPNQPLTRVVASGSNGRAASIAVFNVRPTSKH